MKIAIIDEHPIFIKGLFSIFEGRANDNVIGYALNYEDSLNIISKKKPDIVFLDYTLDNYQGINIIKKYYGNINIRFIVITDNITYDILKKLEDLEVDAIVLKNTTIDEIQYAYDMVKKNKKYYDPNIYEFISVNNNCIDLLTKRELDVLIELANGLNNQQIAEKLFVSIYTVKKHVSQILSKLNVKDRTQAVIYFNNMMITNKYKTS